MILVIRRARDLTVFLSRMDAATHWTVRLNRCDTARMLGECVDASLRLQPWFRNSLGCNPPGAGPTSNRGERRRAWLLPGPGRPGRTLMAANKSNSIRVSCRAISSGWCLNSGRPFLMLPCGQAAARGSARALRQPVALIRPPARLPSYLGQRRLACGGGRLGATQPTVELIAWRTGRPARPVSATLRRPRSLHRVPTGGVRTSLFKVPTSGLATLGSSSLRTSRTKSSTWWPSADSLPGPSKKSELCFSIHCFKKLDTRSWMGRRMLRSKSS